MVGSLQFKVSDQVVYPSHGVGEIIDVESGSIAGISVEVYVISFPHDKMVLRVPVKRAASAGLRSLVGRDDVAKVFKILKGRAKVGNKMWSRRAQEYETKINSGDIIAIAEVIRDLHKDADTDRSYSERTIYESALNRLAREVAVLEGINVNDAVSKLYEALGKTKAA